jgi:hypothetical protein
MIKLTWFVWGEVKFADRGRLLSDHNRLHMGFGGWDNFRGEHTVLGAQIEDRGWNRGHEKRFHDRKGPVPRTEEFHTLCHCQSSWVSCSYETRPRQTRKTTEIWHRVEAFRLMQILRNSRRFLFFWIYSPAFLVGVALICETPDRWFNCDLSKSLLILGSFKGKNIQRAKEGQIAREQARVNEASPKEVGIWTTVITRQYLVIDRTRVWALAWHDLTALHYTRIDDLVLFLSGKLAIWPWWFTSRYRRFAPIDDFSRRNSSDGSG